MFKAAAIPEHGKTACHRGVKMDYEQELFAQRTPYLQWLLEQEDKLDKDYEKRREGLEGLGKQIRRLSFSSCLDSVQDVVCDAIEPDNTAVYLFVKESGALSWAASFVMLETFLADGQTIFAYADEDYKGSLKELYDIECDEFSSATLDTIEKNISRLSGCNKEKMGIYRGMPWFKPDFSPDTLASFFYIGSIFAIRGDKLYSAMDRYGKDISLYRLVYGIFMEEVNTIFVDMDGKKCRHDVISRKIAHIPIVLYTNDRLSDCNELPGLNMLWGKESAVQTQKNGCVSIIIPSKDNAQVLETCLISLIKYTAYKNYELIIVDNGSCDGQKAYINHMIGRLRQEYAAIPITYLYEKMAFNFSKMCNIGARAAQGEFLLFLNDDIEAINTKEGGKWIQNMLEYGEKMHVGAVGAKLYYPFSEEENNACYKIQHVGITNMGIGPAHKLSGVCDKGNLYHGHNTVDYNMLAVTAACMLMKKSTFDKLNGFDEELAVAYNDVELCFRLYEAGFYNVQVNGAVLFHHESLSRGQDTSPEKQKRLQEEKEKLYKKHPLLKNRDPFYSPNLVQWKKDVMYSVCYQFSYDKPLKPTQPSEQCWLHIEKQYQKYSEGKRLGEVQNQHTKWHGLVAKINFKLNGYGRSMLNIDSIVFEGRLAVIRGWHVLTKCDNACIDRKLWLIRITPDKDYFKSYVFAFAPQLRQDVAALFGNAEKKNGKKQTRNTMLAGIHLVVDTTELMKGTYMLGVLAMAGKKKFVAFADHVQTIGW